MTERFIEHSNELFLTNSDIAYILGCSPGTVSGYVANYNRFVVSELESPNLTYTDLLEATITAKTLIKPLTEQEDLFMMLSDFQIGTLITAEGYDKDPEATVETYFETIKSELMRVVSTRKIKIKNFNLMLLGDLVDGWGIYPGQLTIPMNQQVNKMIKLLLEFFIFVNVKLNPEKIRVFGVPGNHGRISRYHAPGDNWDNMVHERLHEKLTNLKFYDQDFDNIEFNYNPEKIQLVNIGKWTYLLTHGDLFGSYDSKSIERKQSSLLRSLGWHDAMLLGHWHRFSWFSMDGIQVVVNGCTYKSNFVKNRIGGKEDLIQVLFGSSDKDPVAWVEKIYAE